MSTKTETRIQTTLDIDTFVDLVGVLENQVAELAKGLAYTSDTDQAEGDQRKITKLAAILAEIGMNNKEVQAYVGKKS